MTVCTGILLSCINVSVINGFFSTLDKQSLPNYFLLLYGRFMKFVSLILKMHSTSHHPEQSLREAWKIGFFPFLNHIFRFLRSGNQSATNASMAGFRIYICAIMPVGITVWILLAASGSEGLSLLQKGNGIASQPSIPLANLNQDESASMNFNLSGNTRAEFRLQLPLSTFFYSGLVITFPDGKTVEVGAGKSLCRMRQVLTMCLQSTERAKNCWKPSRRGLNKNETVALYDILTRIVLCSENL